MLVLSGVEWSGVTHIARKGTREKSTRGGHALQILHVGKAPWRKVAVQYTQYLINCWVSKPNINLIYEDWRTTNPVFVCKIFAMNNHFKQESLWNVRDFVFQIPENLGTFTPTEKRKKRKKWKIPFAALTVCVDGVLKLPLDICYLVGVAGRNMRTKMLYKSITAR